MRPDILSDFDDSRKLDGKTKSGRVYPKDLLSKEIKKYEEKLKSKGELEHPKIDYSDEFTEIRPGVFTDSDKMIHETYADAGKSVPPILVCLDLTELNPDEMGGEECCRITSQEYNKWRRMMENLYVMKVCDDKLIEKIKLQCNEFLKKHGIVTPLGIRTDDIDPITVGGDMSKSAKSIKIQNPIARSGIENFIMADYFSIHMKERFTKALLQDNARLRGYSFYTTKDALATRDDIMTHGIGYVEFNHGDNHIDMLIEFDLMNRVLWFRTDLLKIKALSINLANVKYESSIGPDDTVRITKTAAAERKCRREFFKELSLYPEKYEEMNRTEAMIYVLCIMNHYMRANIRPMTSRVTKDSYVELKTASINSNYCTDKDESNKIKKILVRRLAGRIQKENGLSIPDPDIDFSLDKLFAKFNFFEEDKRKDEFVEDFTHEKRKLTATWTHDDRADLKDLMHIEDDGSGIIDTEYRMPDGFDMEGFGAAADTSDPDAKNKVLEYLKQVEIYTEQLRNSGEIK